MEVLSVTKEPRWTTYLGVLLAVTGLIGFIPFKFDGWQMASGFLHISLVVGILLCLRGFQKIGWRLSLEGNILYYQKFNLYSSWKKRRSAEFSLSTEKINSIKQEGSTLRITYDPGRELKFDTRGINSFSQRKLREIINTLK